MGLELDSECVQSMVWLIIWSGIGILFYILPLFQNIDHFRPMHID